MPAKSKAQLRWAYATAEGKTSAPASVGREFIAKTPKAKVKSLPEQMRQHLTPKGKLRRGD